MLQQGLVLMGYLLDVALLDMSSYAQLCEGVGNPRRVRGTNRIL